MVPDVAGNVQDRQTAVVEPIGVEEAIGTGAEAPGKCAAAGKTAEWPVEF